LAIKNHQKLAKEISREVSKFILIDPVMMAASEKKHFVGSNKSK
jgi:hypothetical protein